MSSASRAVRRVATAPTDRLTQPQYAPPPSRGAVSALLRRMLSTATELRLAGRSGALKSASDELLSAVVASPLPSFEEYGGGGGFAAAGASSERASLIVEAKLGLELLERELRCDLPPARPLPLDSAPHSALPSLPRVPLPRSSVVLSRLRLATSGTDLPSQEDAPKLKTLLRQALALRIAASSPLVARGTPPRAARPASPRARPDRQLSQLGGCCLLRCGGAPTRARARATRTLRSTGQGSDGGEEREAGAAGRRAARRLPVPDHVRPDEGPCGGERRPHLRARRPHALVHAGLPRLCTHAPLAAPPLLLQPR